MKLETIVKTGHGGARKGAGRKPKENETHTAYTAIDVRLLEGIETIGVSNRTAYINYLIANDLAQKIKPKKEFVNIAGELSDKF
jgi:hypothetical protein